MVDGGDGGVVIVAGVGKNGALGEEAVEAGAIVGTVAGEVIVTELIEDDGHHQLGFSRRGAGDGTDRQSDSKEAFHG